MDEKLSKVDPKLLDLLVCPLSKGRLSFNRESNELISERVRLAYPCWCPRLARSRTDLRLFEGLF